MYRGLGMREIVAGWIEGQVAGAERAEGSMARLEREAGEGPGHVDSC